MVFNFGWCGVDLFFVLSGFLITGILLNTKSAVNRARSFYARRVLRIAPVYYLTLLTVFSVAVFSWRVRDLLPPPGWNRWCYLFYLQNVPQIWASPLYMPNLIWHLWSVAAEEQFYFIWPLVVWLTPRRYTLRVALLGALASAILCIFYQTHFGHEISWVCALPGRCSLGLLTGASIAAWADRGRTVSKGTLAIAALLGAAMVGFIALRDPNEFAVPEDGHYIFSVGLIGLALLFGSLVAAAAFKQPLTFFRLPPMTWLGRHSYGIYAYHIPTYWGVAFLFVRHFHRDVASLSPISTLLYCAALFTITFGIAWLSYRLFEQPILSFKNQFAPRYSRPDGSSQGRSSANQRQQLQDRTLR
jgi:peptidoglycan/LPS O-acetylase OafA/YrhL